jgi:teichoic acid transport system permease protein
MDESARTIVRRHPLREGAHRVTSVDSRPESVSKPGHEGLRDARETDKLGVYLSELWRRRSWAWYVSSSEMRSRQINSLLGNIWHVLSPLLQIGVFFIIFGLVLETDRGVDNFIGYLAVGIFVYMFTQKTVNAGAKSLVKYERLMQIVSFPRALIPLTTTLTETLATIPAYVVMFVMVTLSGEQPKLSWLLVIPFLGLQAIFTAGFALAMARAVSHVYDVSQILPFLFRLGFYASGVLFNVNSFIEGKSWRLLFEINPLYCFIEINRAVVLDGGTLDLSLLVTAVAWTVVVAVGGLLWFRAAEDSYGDR